MSHPVPDPAATGFSSFLRNVTRLKTRAATEAAATVATIGSEVPSKTAVPPVGEKLRIAQKKRIVAETDSGLTVGNLPTKYNFLASCLKDGWSYVGSVRASSGGPPIATVSADFGALPPS